MTSHLEVVSFEAMFMTMVPPFFLTTALPAPARTLLWCVRRSVPIVVIATEVKKPAVKNVSYESPLKIAKCASSAIRFSGMERCGLLSTAPSAPV